MNTCAVAYSYYESDNRIRRYAETLVKRGDNVDFFAIGYKGQKAFEVINGVNVYRIQSRVVNEKHKLDYFFRIVLFLFRSFYHITIKHLKRPYKLVHVHSVPDFEVFAALVPRLTGAKVILDIHDLVPEFYCGKFKSGKNNLICRLLLRIERVCCSFANHVIISNDLWRDKLISRSVRRDKCTTILNYPDPAIFTYTDKNCTKATNAPFIAVYPGSLNYHQGVDIAVKAMKIVNKTTKNIQFHIYGSGPLVPELKKLISNDNLADSVFLFEDRSLEAIAEVLLNADLGIVPKRADGFGNEAFSTKIFEFMLMGVPVIAAETKIDRYYFNDSVIEFFHAGDENSLAEKVLHIYSDSKRREEIVQNALTYAESNSWSKKKSVYLKIVDQLCGIPPVRELQLEESRY